ncbi:tetratricopeptide repeat protein [Pseudomonas syringae]|uniref:tetratricopeptide repeat protein n=1 Tax=Pseudomonas syringae TaxID=317 RepID=UPI001372D030|nr:tetratricopeptide repeat protein [Pseudomonas syringae]
MISKKALFAVVFMFATSVWAEKNRVVCDPDSNFCSIQVEKNYCGDGEIAKSRWNMLSGEYVLSCECDCTAQENRFWIVSSSGDVKSLDASKILSSIDLSKNKQGIPDTFGVVPFCRAENSGSNVLVFLEKLPSNKSASAPYCYSQMKQESAELCITEECLEKKRVVTDFGKKYKQQFLLEFKNSTSRLYKEKVRFADFPKKAFVESYLNNYGYSQGDQQLLNDVAYFWQQADFNSDAIWLLEKIIDSNPERVVAYLNLADAYWSKGDKQAAQKNYDIYIGIMTKQGKQQKIPIRVSARHNSN